MTEPLIECLTADWPAPENVKTLISTRIGGVSSGVYSGANLGDHVGDNALSVQHNKKILVEKTGVTRWQWLEQVHGIEALEVTESDLCQRKTADAVFTKVPQRACAVLTADCLPILLCSGDGGEVAAVHAGWRGLASGIVAKTVAAMSADGSSLMAYLGPAISQQHFEVGGEVRQVFIGQFGEQATQYFKAAMNKPQYYFADLYGLARYALRVEGLRQVYGGDMCTFDDDNRFYSYRRDGVTGRMVSAIWLD